jgi:hypothetical protein
VSTCFFTDQRRQVLKKRVVKVPIKKKNGTISVHETSNAIVGPSEKEIFSSVMNSLKKSDSREISLNIIQMNLTHHALDHLDNDQQNPSHGNETETSDNIEEPTRKVVRRCQFHQHLMSRSLLLTFFCIQPHQRRKLSRIGSQANLSSKKSIVGNFLVFITICLLS